ncbi:M56 family metallopeptidase [Anaerovorax odorimutans]|uniref:M56 family metallopeptidase n=1 Tax=Anaerovorax odorimutans TaxID=109327 RepID=UPI0003F9B5BB|nr:M56 family metallopeptidase [Anaerovorax odorimutans]
MLDNLFLQILKMSFTASFVIIIVLFVRLFLKKCPKLFSYILWSVVLFRLICPFSFESNISFVPSKVDSISYDIVSMESHEINTNAKITNSDNEVLLQPTVKSNINKAQDWIPIGKTIWILGISILFIHSLFSLFSLRRKLKASKKIKIEYNVYGIDGLDTAFVLGFFKPNIYIPLGLNEKENNYILLHEKTHIKRFDHIIRILSFFILCVHWFNPLVWAAFIFAMKDMEMSCDESVLKHTDSDIRKDYASSLLNLASKQNNIKAGPLFFGEGDIKTRIKNTLNYKKPTFWFLILLIILIIYILIGLFANPKAKVTTVEDYANLYIKQEMKNYENLKYNDNSIKITDKKITKLEKIAQFDNLMKDSVEIWQLKYRLKPDDISKVILAGGMNEIDGWLTEESSMGKPLLVFTNKHKKYKYLGNMWSGDDSNGNIYTKAGKEILTRVFLEENGLIPKESYKGKHAIADFTMSTGETSRLLLSKPIKQSSDGIWSVERWMDGNGAIYYEVPDTDKSIEAYYDYLQELSNEESYKWLKDPKAVSLNYINDVLNQPFTIKQLNLKIKDNIELKEFYDTPVSEYIGYISNFLKDDKTYFYLDRVEWLTSAKDIERLKELKIDPKTLNNGYYIYNPATYPDYFQINEKSKYYIINSSSETLYEKEVSLEKIKDSINTFEKENIQIPFKITTKDGYVTEIRELYIP